MLLVVVGGPGAKPLPGVASTTLVEGCGVDAAAAAVLKTADAGVPGLMDWGT